MFVFVFDDGRILIFVRLNLGIRFGNIIVCFWVKLFIKLIILVIVLKE